MSEYLRVRIELSAYPTGLPRIVATIGRRRWQIRELTFADGHLEMALAAAGARPAFVESVLERVIEVVACDVAAEASGPSGARCASEPVPAFPACERCGARGDVVYSGLGLRLCANGCAGLADT